MQILGLLLVVLGLLALRLLLDRLDRKRIRRHRKSMRCEVDRIRWRPFGYGWPSSARIYGVKYMDADGDLHKASCKTSILGDVYFGNDRMLRASDRAESESPPAGQGSP